MAVSAPPPPTVEIDDGVIEEARRRQRRRRIVASALLAGLAATGGLVALLATGGGAATPHRGRSFPPPPPLSAGVIHGRLHVDGQLFPIAVRPALAAGEAALSVMAVTGGCGGCGGDLSYPTRSTLLWSEGVSNEEHQVGRQGEIDFALVQPRVAAVRVSGFGILKPFAVPGLPPRVRVVALYRPAGSPGMFVPPGDVMYGVARFLRTTHTRAVTMTPLDARGRPLPNPHYSPNLALQLPYGYWATSANTSKARVCRVIGPNPSHRSRHARLVVRCRPAPPPPSTPPANGRCAVSSSSPNVQVEWGQIATKIAAYQATSLPAFLACEVVWYAIPNGGSLQVAVLLNAKQPGTPPPPLWGSIPTRGEPGIVQIRPVNFSEPPVHASGAPPGGFVVTVGPVAAARRDGNAWLLVEGGSFAQDLAFLKTLQITRVDL